MNYTQNYQLPQWVETDRILMEDFNDAFDTIESAMSGFGNCQVYTTSYVGTNRFGSSDRNTLTFPGRPLLVFIWGEDSGGIMLAGYLTGFALAYSNHQVLENVDWTETTLTWHNSDSSFDQLNVAGWTYHVAALLDAAE